MKFELQSASSKYDDYPIIEINTLEELLDHVKKEDNSIIISTDIFKDENEEKGCKFSLETYDSYRE